MNDGRGGRVVSQACRLAAAHMNRLVALFFVSGAAGLIYESIWSRELHRIFGTSQFAIATVLAAFMTGLALGGTLGAKYAHLAPKPLRTYAVLEAFIGLFALIFPFLMHGIEPLYLWFWSTFQPGVVAFGVFQFVVLGLVLLLPTACMGATLPLLIQLLTDRAQGSATGRLYAVNTAGAVFGTWLAGFWLLPTLGVQGTTWLAAATNVLLAVVAWRLDAILAIESSWAEHTTDPIGVPAYVPAIDPPEPNAKALTPAPPPATASAIPWLVVAALAGFSSLVLEVAWFRVLTLILGASTYAFSIMLLAFLAGIASGGEVAGPVSDKLAAKGRVWIGIAAAQFAVAALTFAAMWAWPYLPVTFAKAFFAIRPMADTLLWPMKCAIALAVMAPPAFFMGASFPLLVRAATASTPSLAAAVGRVYAANTVGSLSGAFLAGFVLLPQLHVTGTVLLALSVNILAALAALAMHARHRWQHRPERMPILAGASLILVVGAVFIATAPKWDPMMMTTGIYKYVDNLEEPTQAEIRRDMIDRYELLYYAEGLTSVVTVAQNKVTKNVWLANNGKIDASSTTDMPTQIMVTHLPFLFTGADARSAIVIGLASGITLGAATLHPELTRIDVVEIEPSIREATEFFRPWNHNALDDPRVNLIANDGRNQLLLTPPGTYDVIVCEPSNPWLTGVSNLFTKEFFEMGKSRLATNGVWAQWVQMYGMDNRDLKAVMKTFAAVFPYVHVFATIEDADLVMVGSDRPLILSPEGAEFLRNRSPNLLADMKQIDMTSPWLILSTWLFDQEGLAEFVGDVPLNTDDNLLVEFSAPKNLHRETSTENFRNLRRMPYIPTMAVSDVDGLMSLAQAYEEREELPRALMALKEALRINPTREDVKDLRAAYETKLVAPE